MNLLVLYIEFFKIGVFAVGGGLATLPFLFLMANDRFTFIRQTGWLTTEQVSNFLAIAQCSPGPIGINVAAQTGFQYGGAFGGIIAVLGLASPAFITIAALAKTLQTLRDNKRHGSIIERIFSGLRPAAAGLLCAAVLGVWQIALYNSSNAAWYKIIRLRESLVCAALFLLIVKFKTHPIICIAVGAAVGIVLGL